MQGLKGLAKWRRTGALLVGVCVVIIVPFILWEEPIEAFFQDFGALEGQARWLSAAILFGALALDIFLPVPSSLVSTLFGMLLGVGWGWLGSFLAMNVSAAIGYWLGARGSALARRALGEAESALLTDFFARRGPMALVALRAVPVLAEASCLFAGMARAPVGKSALALLLGNAAVSLMYALVGAWGREVDAMLPAFGASLLLSGVLMLLARRRV
ncbi:MAG: VTT domain-containing protein [Lentisphaeraceae bacterium]|nr:VTT domain-containing protein [Lentisphaeraceae bacterium]